MQPREEHRGTGDRRDRARTRRGVGRRPTSRVWVCGPRLGEVTDLALSVSHRDTDSWTKTL